MERFSAAIASNVPRGAYLLAKYEAGYSGSLTNWGRTALPVAVDLLLWELRGFFRVCQP